MSNFPHSAALASSLSSSPYAIQSNLETLINRARQHPEAGRVHDDAVEPQGSNAHFYAESPRLGTSVHSPESSPERSIHGATSSSMHNRRWSHAPSARMALIRETSYQEGAIFLDEDEMDAIEADERTALTAAQRARRQSAFSAKSARSGRSGRQGDRRSYGSTNDAFSPVMRFTPSVPEPQKGARRPSKTGSSRSRSKARTPPKHSKHTKGKSNGTTASAVDSELSSATPSDSDADEGEATPLARGRGTDSRPLSRNASPSSSRMSSSRYSFSVNGLTRSQNFGSIRGRRASDAIRMGGDSSGDEGGDVARGLAASGGGVMFGGRSGLGLAPGEGLEGLLDPAEELGPRDLELPLNPEGKEVHKWTEAMRAELPILLRMSLPVFFTQMAEWSLVLASTVSVGHLGTTDLAATTLASMTASVSSFSILQGLATALDTLLPAAWTSSDPTRVGLWTQRMGVVLAVSMIPMFVLWWNVTGVLIALGQDLEVAVLAGRYLKYLSFGIPGYGGNVIVKKYLQAQNLMHVPTYTLFVVAPVNLLLNYLLIWGPPAIRLGFVGGAVSTAASYNLLFVLNTIYALFLGPREAFHPLTFKSTFSKLGTVTSLGLAGTIMLSSEWWAWEACALAASLLGPTTLAAQSVVLSTASTFYQVPAALGIASAVRCGNLLGAGSGWEAKWASRASMLLSLILAVINSVILMAARKNWGYLFNSDPEVVKIVAQIMPYIALFQTTDGVAAAAGAILRSLGLHTTGALINLTSYYIIGLPFGIWLCFTPKVHLGLVGIWIGLSAALGYASVISIVLVWKANWTRAVERVRERLGFSAQGQMGEDGKWTGEEGGAEEPMSP